MAELELLEQAILANSMTEVECRFVHGGSGNCNGNANGNENGNDNCNSQACASDVVWRRSQPCNDRLQFFCLCKGGDTE